MEIAPERTASEVDVRFALANERTLLAWLRTALAGAVVTVGVVLLIAVLLT